MDISWYIVLPIAVARPFYSSPSKCFLLPMPYDTQNVKSVVLYNK